MHVGMLFRVMRDYRDRILCMAKMFASGLFRIKLSFAFTVITYATQSNWAQSRVIQLDRSN